LAIKISELSKQVGCPVQTIRFYEQEGLVPAPARTAGNYRLYTISHVERLRFIRHCRSLDMTLDEIRQLLKLRDTPQESCADVNALLDEHIDQVARRIGELRALETHLKDLRRLCGKARPAQNCAILRELASPQSGASDVLGPIASGE
jgi:Cd(II)/Pb(II)-responsive transcriptional regulator